MYGNGYWRVEDDLKSHCDVENELGESKYVIVLWYY
jgi:hypothetical protein